MWKCQKCGKPVYFAERRQSLGYDWHPTCLKCEECGKVLNPGTHAEHRGVPYCHVPCYAALFGPQLFGHGSTTESHRNFGRRENSFIREHNQLKTKLDEYNSYYNKVAKNQISSREVNGRFLLEGILKVYWGTEASVRLKEYDDSRVIHINNRNRKAMSVGPDFVNAVPDVAIDAVEKQEESEDNDTDNEGSLPYFNPRTHPLFRESLVELNKASMDPFYNKLLDQNLLEDVDNDNLLSYDPIQKWKTLNNLVNSNENVHNDADETDNIVTNSDKVQRSHSVQEKDVNKNSIIDAAKSFTLPYKLQNFQNDIGPPANVEDNEPEVTNDSQTNDTDITNDDKENIASSKAETQNTDYKEKFTNDFDKKSHRGKQNLSPDRESTSKSKGPRALRRRHGKKMDKNRKLRRRSSINGHWYDRDTSVFTPPKHTPMCVYTSSKMSPGEVITTLMDKYKIESSPADYALYVVKETGETRLVSPQEFPLVLRVNLGPHEDISKIYLMDKKSTTEISQEVAQYLNFSYAELRSFLNMFYEEEEREADRIRTKFLVIRRRLQYVLRMKQGQGQVWDQEQPSQETQVTD